MFQVVTVFSDIGISQSFEVRWNIYHRFTKNLTITKFVGERMFFENRSASSKIRGKNIAARFFGHGVAVDLTPGSPGFNSD